MDKWLGELSFRSRRYAGLSAMTIHRERIEEILKKRIMAARLCCKSQRARAKLFRRCNVPYRTASTLPSPIRRTGSLFPATTGDEPGLGM